MSRLASWAENLAGTTNDQSATYSYSPASQIASTTRTNDAYAWTGHGSGSTASAANGLNQLSGIGTGTPTYDGRGNLTFDPTSGKAYSYTGDNLLASSANGTSASLAYDPLLRLYQLAGAADTTRFAYDGLAMIAEYNGSNVLQRRFVHGPGTDEPLVQYEGSGTSDRRWLHADERGSIVAASDASGASIFTNRYDEFGKPQTGNTGRFQYTGQMWLPEVGAYHYKARVYSPTFGGRFLQTDPINVAGGINLYAYVGNDPINLVDPLGLAWPDNPCGSDGETIVCRAGGMGGNTFIGGSSGSATGGGRFFIDMPIDSDGSGVSGDEQTLPCSPTEEQLKGSGPVIFSGVTSAGYLLLGHGMTAGTFTTASGISGSFLTDAYGTGLGGNFQGVSGGFNNLYSFVGVNDNFGLSTPIGEFTGHLVDWNLVGATGGIGTQFGIPDILKTIMNPTTAFAATSVSITFSNTEIFNVTCPR